MLRLLVDLCRINVEDIGLVLNIYHVVEGVLDTGKRDLVESIDKSLGEDTETYETDKERPEKCYRGVRVKGLMGMATNTDDETVIRADFERIARLKRRINEEFPSLVDFTELSIGMSSDWRIAVEYGATLVRIGSAIFGPRNY